MKKLLEPNHSFIKVSLSLLWFIGFSFSAFGQFQVVSITPMDGTVNVNTVIDIEITFSAPLDTTARFPKPGGLFLDLWIQDNPPIGEPDGMLVSSDLMTVTFTNISLEADTKYIFGVLAAKGLGGEPLDLPVLVNFTTGNSLPSGSVSGSVSFPGDNPRGAIVFLFEELFGEEDYPPFAAIVNQATGEYIVNYVGSGSYLPVSILDNNGNGEVDINEGDPTGFYDRGSDMEPGSITISDGQNVLVGVDMTLHIPEKTTARDWLDEAETKAQAISPDGLPGTIVGVDMDPDGESYMWIYGFQSSGDHFGIVISSLFHMVLGDQLDLPMGQFPLPDNWLDSDVIADTANANGGEDFLDQYPDANITPFLISMSADDPDQSNEFLSPALGKNNNNNHLLSTLDEGDTLTLWMVRYSDEYSGDEINIPIDAITGRPMDFEPGPEGDPTTAKHNLSVAEQWAHAWSADRQLTMILTHMSSVDSEGRALMWGYFYYSANLDSGRLFLIQDENLLYAGPLNWGSYPMNPLPGGWIDSDSAMSVGEANGIAQFRTDHFDDVNVSALLMKGMDPMQPDRSFWWFYCQSGSGDSLIVMVDALTGQLISDVAEQSNGAYPESVVLGQNYPNPFNPNTTISYQLPMVSEVELSIYNLLGQKMTTLVSEKQPAGNYKIQFDASMLASGIYFYQLKTENFSQMKKMILTQ